MSSKRGTRPPKRQNEWAGCDSIPEVFAFAFRCALGELAGADLATLSRTSAVPTLGWLARRQQVELAAYLELLSRRAKAQRYRVRVAERARLLSLLGSGGLDDPRRLFCLAWSIDDAFTELGDDAPAEATAANVLCPRRSYFDDIANPPPPLGQMTGAAILRARFRNFWYVGPLHKFDSFGPLPTPRSRALPARLAQRLESAVEDELRVAVVSWRSHGGSDLSLPEVGEGLFAMTGYSEALDPSLIERVLDELSKRRIHLAVMHELAATRHEVALLEGALRERARAYPALTAIGLVHQACPDGSYANRALLLGADGTTLLEHEKLEPFTHPELGMEAIIPRKSGDYEFVDTPIGRLAVNICRDVRSDVPGLLNRVLGVATLLVPAYSKNLDFALEEGRVLGARQRAMVIVANALRKGLSQVAAMYFPVRGRAESERVVPQPPDAFRVVVTSASAGRDPSGQMRISEVDFQGFT